MQKFKQDRIAPTTKKALGTLSQSDHRAVDENKIPNTKTPTKSSAKKINPSKSGLKKTKEVATRPSVVAKSAKKVKAPENSSKIETSEAIAKASLESISTTEQSFSDYIVSSLSDKSVPLSGFTSIAENFSIDVQRIENATDIPIVIQSASDCQIITQEETIVNLNEYKKTETANEQITDVIFDNVEEERLLDLSYLDHNSSCCVPDSSVVEIQSPDYISTINMRLTLSSPVSSPVSEVYVMDVVREDNASDWEGEYDPADEFTPNKTIMSPIDTKERKSVPIRRSFVLSSLRAFVRSFQAEEKRKSSLLFSQPSKLSLGSLQDPVDNNDLEALQTTNERCPISPLISNRNTSSATMMMPTTETTGVDNDDILDEFFTMRHEDIYEASPALAARLSSSNRELQVIMSAVKLSTMNNNSNNCNQNEASMVVGDKDIRHENIYCSPRALATNMDGSPGCMFISNGIKRTPKVDCTFSNSFCELPCENLDFTLDEIYLDDESSRGPDCSLDSVQLVDIVNTDNYDLDCRESIEIAQEVASVTVLSNETIDIDIRVVNISYEICNTYVKYSLVCEVSE